MAAVSFLPKASERTTMVQAANGIGNGNARTHSPGYLMAPFSWAATPLAAMLETDPSLYSALFTLSRRRMHLIALSVAHWHGAIDAHFARLVMVGVPATVLDHVFGRRPPGLKRALGHLPVGVLPRDSYLYLIELLEEPAAAKLLNHVYCLSEEYLTGLHSIPSPLRRIAAGAIREGVSPTGLGDGLRLLAALGAAANFDALVASLAAIRQPAQFAGRLARLVEQLPLRPIMPPQRVGGARRIDRAAEIRQLAKRWKNCLADCYLDTVNDGRAAVYLWPHAQAPAACVVTRHGRLGWALHDAKGPENAELPPARLKEIRDAFAAAGIPGEAAVEALENAARARSLRRHAMRRARRNEAAEIEEIYEDIEAFEAALAA
jgi:hypothetical protein